MRSKVQGAMKRIPMLQVVVNVMTPSGDPHPYRVCWPATQTLKDWIDNLADFHAELLDEDAHEYTLVYVTRRTDSPGAKVVEATSKVFIFSDGYQTRVSCFLGEGLHLHQPTKQL